MVLLWEPFLLGGGCPLGRKRPACRIPSRILTFGNVLSLFHVPDKAWEKFICPGLLPYWGMTPAEHWGL